MEPFTSAIQLMQRSTAVTLSSLENDGSPVTRAMLNLRNRSQYPDLVDEFDADSLSTYLTTNTSSPKMKQLREDGRVCLYYMLPEQWWGLSVSGSIEEVLSTEMRHRIWQDGWRLYYPKGADDEDYSILKVVPHSARLYRQMQAWTIEPIR